jgi:hypothetical protein
MEQLQNLIERIQKVYYTDLLMLTTELIALIIGLLYIRKQKTGQLFIFYILFDLLILVSNLYLSSLNWNSMSTFKINFVYYSNSLISLIELSVYFYFFKEVLKNRRMLKALKIMEITYILVMIVFLTTRFQFLTGSFMNSTYTVGALEFVFLMPPCLMFFYEIINKDSAISLHERPSFWIVTGIFFYAFISIPYYLLAPNIRQTPYFHILVSTLFNIPYSINFVFLTKSFLCRKCLTI